MILRMRPGNCIVPTPVGVNRKVDLEKRRRYELSPHPWG